MAADQAITLRAATPATSSGDAPPVFNGIDRQFVELIISVSAFAQGGPASRLVLIVETAPAPQDWVAIYTSPDITDVRALNVALVGCDRYLRARWTLADGAQATFGVEGVSHQMYAHNLDVAALSLPNAALASIDPVTLARGGLAATDEAVSYLGKGYKLPLVSWGSALRMHVANMAAYHAMKRRGFDPENDQLIRMGYTDAIAWLKSGALSDPSIVDTTPAETPGAIYMVSRPARGWAHR